MKRCPACGTEYSVAQGFCPMDGAPLADDDPTAPTTTTTAPAVWDPPRAARSTAEARIVPPTRPPEGVLIPALTTAVRVTAGAAFVPPGGPAVADARAPAFPPDSTGSALIPPMVRTVPAPVNGSNGASAFVPAASARTVMGRIPAAARPASDTPAAGSLEAPRTGGAVPTSLEARAGVAVPEAPRAGAGLAAPDEGAGSRPQEAPRTGSGAHAGSGPHEGPRTGGAMLGALEASRPAEIRPDAADVAGAPRLVQVPASAAVPAEGVQVAGAFFPAGGIARAKSDPSSMPASWEDALVGRVLDQRYRIDARIGAGAMGVVYKATHVIIDKPLAIKLLRPDVGAQPDVVKRFLLEAQLAGRIKHPNVVDISDYGQIAGQTAYYVMEYLTGSTLAHRIDEVGRLEPALAIDIAIQTAQALQAAHANKIVHRDLKSENIFLCERADGELQVKILDFGIARVRDKKTRLTAMGALIGTPAYMSPEQAQGQEVDERSDLYALGIILFEMLAGRVPFKAPTVAMVLSAQIFDAPPTLKEVEAATADLPNVEHLIHLLLAKNRDERPKDAAEVIHLLRTAAEVDLQPSSMLSTSSAARRRATVTIGSWSVADNPSGLTRVDPPVAAVGEARTTPRPDVDAVTARPVTASGRIQRRPSVIVPVGTPVERFAAPLTRPTAGDHDHRQSPTGVNRAVRAGPPMILIVAAAASIGAAITVTLYKQVWRKSPAPVQSAAALPHAAPPPVVPAPTRITLESDPPGATVVGEDGEVWGVTPFTRELVATAPRTRVVFRLAGHDEAGLDVSPAESARLKIHLRPSVVPVAPAPTSPEVPAEVVSDPPKGAASGKPRPAKAKTEAAVDRPPDPAGEPPPPAEEELDMGELKNPFRKK